MLKIRIPLYSLETARTLGEALGVSHTVLMGEAITTESVHRIERDGPLSAEPVVHTGHRPRMLSPHVLATVTGVGGHTKRAVTAAAIRMGVSEARLMRAAIDRHLGGLLGNV